MLGRFPFQKNLEYIRYRLAEIFSGLIYSKYKFSEFAQIWREDGAFLDYYRKMVGRVNYHSLDRKFTLDQLLKLTARVAGDTVECGAYEGASSWLIYRAGKGQGKTHHVFDSFAGLNAPRKEDGEFWKPGDMTAAEEKCKSNLREFDFVKYYIGWIPQRFPEVAGWKFSFVHLDVDLHQPTQDSLEFFYPRMSPGGIILCDDYGFSTCPGSKKAMDEFFAAKPEKIVHLPTGQAFIIKA